MAALLKRQKHGGGGFRVMTGWADGNERIFRLSTHDLIHSEDCATRRTQRCLETTS
jgi:hypothetical protein